MFITRFVVCRRIVWVVIMLSLWLPWSVNHECRSLLFDVVRFLVCVRRLYVVCMLVVCRPLLLITMLFGCVICC